MNATTSSYSFSLQGYRQRSESKSQSQILLSKVSCNQREASESLSSQRNTSVQTSNMNSFMNKKELNRFHDKVETLKIKLTGTLAERKKMKKGLLRSHSRSESEESYQRSSQPGTRIFKKNYKDQNTFATKLEKDDSYTDLEEACLNDYKDTSSEKEEKEEQVDTEKEENEEEDLPVSDATYSKKSYLLKSKSSCESNNCPSVLSSLSRSSISEESSDLNHYKYRINHVLNKKYLIEDKLSEGTFGRVLDCKNLRNGSNVAVKVIRPIQRYIDSAKLEASILRRISDEVSCKYYVNMLDSFSFINKHNNEEHYAIVFEKLGQDLLNHIKKNNYYGFSISLIKDIGKQILEGVSRLHEKYGLIHTDLKLENIMFTSQKKIEVNPKKLPSNVRFKQTYSKDSLTTYYEPESSEIRIIDFGSATYKKDKCSGIINTRQYRAPEVILKCCDWDEKTDVWSIACILIELYTGELFFPTHNDEEHLCLIEKACGKFPTWMSQRSAKVHIFDNETERINTKRLEEREEAEEALKVFHTLDDLILESHSDFKDLLKQMFSIDPKKRVTCIDALKHNFFQKE